MTRAVRSKGKSVAVMTHRLVHIAVLVLLLAMTSAACARLKTDVDPETITDAASLADYLQENYVGLLDEGPFISPTMSVPGHAYTPTSGGTLHVFKYPTDADALTDVTLLDKQRDARNSPHLYRKADLVVIYWGDDPRLETALLRVFGSRIA